MKSDARFDSALLRRSDQSGRRYTSADVREIAGVLGIRYRALADGEFNHTSALVLLDADGRILARTEQVGSKVDPQFMARVRDSLLQPAPLLMNAAPCRGRHPLRCVIPVHNGTHDAVRGPDSTGRQDQRSRRLHGNR